MRLIEEQAAIDALEKCYTCKHVYQRVSDADTLYCRCRKGCKYEEIKPKEALEILNDMKVKIEIPKAAVMQYKRNAALDMAIEALKCSEIPNCSDCISRNAAIDALDKRFDSIPMEQTVEVLQLRRDLRELPPAQPEPEELDFVQPHKKIDVRLEIGQPDRSLWFRIGEICVDESKGFISAGRAVEKIRELLREAERREE